MVPNSRILSTKGELFGQAKRYGVVLFVLSVFFFALIDYGGVRSSDSEVVFRVAESLADRGAFSLNKDLEDWHAFGVAYGKGYRLYSIFGPLESVLLAPIVKAGELINETGWYKSMVPMLSLSHLTSGGFFDYYDGVATRTPEPHALRMIASVFNVFVSAIGVFLFWKILLLLTKSIPASFLVSLVYALGTNAWAYAGTFFSEPLATALVLASFLFLLKAQEAGQPERGWSRTIFLSGIWMGFAITAHITAALFAPFFTLYFFWKEYGELRLFWSRLERASIFSLGVFLLLFALGWYNYFRFGSFFETGRTVSAMSAELFGYGTFVFPLRGLYGLIFGAGKGVVFYMPVLVVSGLMWKEFLNFDRKLFWVMTGAIAFRLLFVASRSDWHGGFCLGPRYLVMAIPFLLLPLAFWLRSHEEKKFTKAYAIIAASAVIFSIQQFYFGLREIFTFYQAFKLQERVAGVNVFVNDSIYLNWKYSPLLNFRAHDRIAPFLLRFMGLSFGELLIVGSVLLGLVFLLVFLFIRGMPRTSTFSGRV